MRAWLAALLAGGGILLPSATAALPIGLSLVPSVAVVSTGDTVNVDVAVSGLARPPSVGAFDLTIGFDPAILSIGTGDVTFGPFLGDPAFEALAEVLLPGPGLVNIAEVSLLLPDTLDVLQPSDFVLATLSFSALAPGTVNFAFAGEIRIDDAFGEKLTVVSEPASLLLMGTGLAALRAIRRRRPGKRRDLHVPLLLLVAAGAALAVVQPATASDTAVAKVKSLVDQQGRGIRDVSATCSLTTNVKNETVSITCEFRNSSKEVKRFVFCLMTDLKDTKIETIAIEKLDGTKSYVLKQEGGDNGTLKCDAVQGGGGALSPASLHFGCQDVTVKPMDKISVPYPSIKYKLKAGVKFAELKADHFQVNYTDQVDLSGRPNKKFDKASCDPAIGQGNFIDYDTDTIAEGVRAQWVFHHAALVDPFVLFQPIAPQVPPGACDATGDGIVDLADVNAIFAARNQVAHPADPRDPDRDGRVTVNDARICTLRQSKQYTTYDDAPCVPTNFPSVVTDLPACAARSGAPPPTTLDLNLFSFYTETLDAGTEVHAMHAVTLGGSTAGLRVETDPRPGTTFVIPAQTDLRGVLRVCSSANAATCVAPSVPEGRRLDVRVDVSSYGEALFYQIGELVQDTEPPRVVSHSVVFNQPSQLAVAVTSTDATTTPIHADFWYSLDGGIGWTSEILAPTSNLFDEIGTRVFVGEIGLVPTGLPIQYFISIRDLVGNVTYFGIGTVSPI